METEWKNILFNIQNIEAQTSSAILIKLPMKSALKGFKFWHPIKLVRKADHMLSFGYTDSFQFRIFKNGAGRYNFKEKVEERIVNAQEIEKAYSRTDQTDWSDTYKEEEEITLLHTPEKLTLEDEQDADPSLLL